MKDNSIIKFRVSNIYKPLFIWTLLLYSIFIYAYDFEVDGICYSYIKNTNNVEVAYKWSQFSSAPVPTYYSGNVIVPKEVFYEGKTYNVVRVGYKAFSSSRDLLSVSLPSSIKSIGISAFEDCDALLSVDMSDDITIINQQAFKGCTSLKEIYLPKGISSIESSVFENCSSLARVEITENITNISQHAFGGCKSLESICIPGSINSIGAYSFSNCSKLTSVIISNGVKNIGIESFFKCAIDTLTIPKSVSTIGSMAFYWCPLSLVKSEIMDPPYVDPYCFDGNKLQIPSGTKEKYEKRNYWVQNFKEIEEYGVQDFSLSISSSGNGYVSYNGEIIRSKTSTFTVNEGTNATISFSADNGYRIKSVKVNSTNVTSSVSNNQYTVSNIQRNVTVEVEFEAIPPTTYTLSVSSTGSGYASYDGTTIRSKTSTFTVNEGTNATISFSADNGYRIKSVKVNSSNVTSSVSNNKYTVSNIQRNTTVEVEFEAIPVTTYTLSIKATGNGSASYDGNTIRSKTSSFTVNEGTSAMITFNPDNGYRVKSVKVNSSDVTSNLSNNKYTISNINKNTTVEVEFQEELKTFTSDGLNYAVLSYDDKTVSLANGKYGTVLEVPATITYQDITWKVAGIDNAALANNEELAAIIWNPSAAFNVSASNPNLLLYVKSASYAPATIQNVVVNSTAESIVLTDAASGNNFYCPKEFTAKKISYTHNYGMITGLGESRGWETIALPFDVKKIAHSSKGELTPFANWRSGDSKKPFWLMSYGTGGWTNASSIKANTPYIISMPNNPDYKAEFRLSGNITFSAENVTVKKSDNLQTGNYGGNTFTPNFSNTDNSGFLALNVNNDYVSYSGGSAEGSTFVVNLRPVHPFEAYMTSTSKTRSTISINGDMATGIEDITQVLIDENKGLRIYNLKGQLIKVEQDKSLEEVRRSLPAGVYIVNGKKLIIK